MNYTTIQKKLFSLSAVSFIPEIELKKICLSCIAYSGLDKMLHPLNIVTKKPHATQIF